MLTNIFTPFPVLKTERLTLRQLSVNDDKEIFALRSDKQVNKYIDRDPSNTIEDARKFIHKIAEVVRQNEGIYWAITLTNNDHLAGTICLFNFSDVNDQAVSIPLRIPMIACSWYTDLEKTHLDVS